MNRRTCCVSATLICCLILLVGCQSSGPSVKTTDLYQRFSLATLGLSNSSDVLTVISDPQIEQLSQSPSVIVSWGNNKKASKIWFNAVVFDEEYLTAIRKYCFYVNESAKGFFVAPTEDLWFEAEVALTEDLVDDPYADENARQIAILNAIRDKFTEDMRQVTPDSNILKSSVMATEQVINGLTNSVLELSPALAAKFHEDQGLSFDHMTLGPGKIRMITENGSVRLRIKVGKGWWRKPNALDVI